MAAIQSDFAQIRSEEMLNEFALQYGLCTTEIMQSQKPQVLQTIGATIDDIQVRVEHRWYDPSGPFQNLPDMNKVTLELNGLKVQEISFSD